MRWCPGLSARAPAHIGDIDLHARALLGAGASAPGDRVVLSLLELTDPLARALAPDTGLLDAAEGGGGIGYEPTVDADHPDLHALGQAQRPSEVTGEDIA